MSKNATSFGFDALEKMELVLFLALLHLYRQKKKAIQHEDAGWTGQILTEARRAQVRKLRMQPDSGPNTNVGIQNWTIENLPLK